MSLDLLHVEFQNPPKRGFWVGGRVRRREIPELHKVLTERERTRMCGFVLPSLPSVGCLINNGNAAELLKCQLAARPQAIIFVACRPSAGSRVRASRRNSAIHLCNLASRPGHILLLFISRWTTTRACCRSETMKNLPPQPSDRHSKGRRRAPV